MGREAHEALGQLDLLLPGQIGQGNYLKPPFDDSILAALRTGFEQAKRRAQEPT